VQVAIGVAQAAQGGAAVTRSVLIGAGLAWVRAGPRVLAGRAKGAGRLACDTIGVRWPLRNGAD
jgi:hypothetical protein